MARSTALSGARDASIWPWLGWALLILVADQLTKMLILGAYQLGDATYVTGFFNIVRAHNTGAAFSFLADAGGCSPALVRQRRCSSCGNCAPTRGKRCLRLPSPASWAAPWAT